MTSAQSMLSRFAQWLLAALLLIGAGGCSSGKPELIAPTVHASPYDTTRGDALWAVVPLVNESGSTVLDEFLVTDAVIAAVHEIRGVSALPLNRTFQAMQALGIGRVATPDEAKRLAEELGVDGIVIGSITAYDPYNPPKLGLSLALVTRERDGSPAGVNTLADVRRLQTSATDQSVLNASSFSDRPGATASVHLDARNHDVLLDIKQYAEGRNQHVSALGWRRYLASMDLYTHYAAWRAVGRLVESEWIVLARGPSGRNR